MEQILGVLDVSLSNNFVIYFVLACDMVCNFKGQIYSQTPTQHLSVYHHSHIASKAA